MKLDHIGIVVADLDRGRRALSDALGLSCWTAEFADPINDVFVQFGRDPSGVCYEIIAPLSANSPVSRAARTGRDITNHVAYLVSDLAKEAARLEDLRFRPIGPPRQAIAYRFAKVQFFVSPILSIVELVESEDHQHKYL
jgi:methylmalonyl-CoA/ethylmalonyl-CoA epimerase